MQIKSNIQIFYYLQSKIAPTLTFSRFDDRHAKPLPVLQPTELLQRHRRGGLRRPGRRGPARAVRDPEDLQDVRARRAGAPGRDLRDVPHTSAEGDEEAPGRPLHEVIRSKDARRYLNLIYLVLLWHLCTSSVFGSLL